MKNHEKASKSRIELTFEGRKFIPHVIELSFGIDRNIYAILDLSIREEKERTLF